MILGLCEEIEKRMTSVGVRCTKITLKVKQRKPGAPPPPKFLGHGSCFNQSKSGLIVGSATREASKLCKTALPLLNSLNIREEDIRGMGVVASGLVSKDFQESEKRPSDEQFEISRLFEPHRQKSSPERLFEPSAHASAQVRIDSHKEKQAKERSISNEDLVSYILPPSSQIHMSQVDELPSPIRLEIVAQMKKTRKIPKTDVSYTGAQSYRQTNVQRMLKLAEVKSHPGNVSLTQLECLPLELQLQIANDDGDDTLRKSSRPTTRKILPSTPEKQEESLLVHLSPRRSDTFELQMAKPFSEFMDQNSAMIEDNVTKVCAFFLACISEGKFADAVVLLRQLRNRADTWKATYPNIFETVNKRMKHHTGATLDQI